MTVHRPPRIRVVEATPNPSLGVIPKAMQKLRVLIANERRDRLELLAQVVIEQAKGILMARHSVDRDGAIVDSHLLLVPQETRAQVDT